MDHDPLTTRPPRELILGFLKTETFYVAILLFVTLMGAWQTYSLFTGRRESPPQERWTQESLDKLIDARIEMLEDAGAWQGRPVIVARKMSDVFQVMGVVALLGMGLAWIVRGKLLAQQETALPRWMLWDVLKLAAIWAAGGVVFGWIFMGNDSAGRDQPPAVLVDVFARLLLIGALILVVREERSARLSDLGLRSDRWVGNVIFGLIGFIAIQPVINGLLHLLTQDQLERIIPPAPLQSSVNVLFRTDSPTTLVLAAIAGVIIVPIGEELLFRGLLLPALQRWMTKPWAIVVSAAFFAAAHMELHVVLPMFALGLGLGYLFSRTRSLVGPVVMHMAFNGFVLATTFAYRIVLLADLPGIPPVR